MKRTFYSTCLLLALFCLPGGYNSWAQSDTSGITHAAKWFNRKAWLNGLALQPHPSVDKKEFARQYAADKARWDKAFAFLKENDLNNLKPGKYPIDGENVFATVTEAPSKEFEKSVWESHRKYQDIQYIINGKEKIGVMPASRGVVTDPYDTARDVIFYTGKGKYYTAQPGTFFIFFPENAHRPNIKVEGFDMVKKVVVKVRTGALPRLTPR